MKNSKILKKSYGTPYDFIKKYLNIEKIIGYPLWFSWGYQNIQKVYGTLSDFLNFPKKYRIITLNYSLEKSWKILLVPPPEKMKKVDSGGGY